MKSSLKKCASQCRGRTLQIPLFFIFFLNACSLTATRPIQEMSNAEAAIKAAKDLNADSLSPELYRNSLEFYFRAKRDYRLKSFDTSRSYAIKATKLAEQAEFESYRLGGATPEASQRLSSPEGAAADPEAAFRDGVPPDEVNAAPPLGKSAPARPEKEKPMDLNDAIQLQKDKDRDAAKEKTKDTPPSSQTAPQPVPVSVPPLAEPNGQTGPTVIGPTGYNQYTPAGQVPSGTTYNTTVAPNAGALPPATSRGPIDTANPQTAPTDLWNRTNYDRLRINRNQFPTPTPTSEAIDPIGDAGMEELGETKDGKTKEIESIDNKKTLNEGLDIAGKDEKFVPMLTPLPAPTPVSTGDN